MQKCCSADCSAAGQAPPGSGTNCDQGCLDKYMGANGSKDEAYKLCCKP